MDASALLHNLKEQVTCSVCSNVYTNPKKLPCLHVFCLECLNGLARASGDHGSFKCPLCGTELIVPETGTLETLPNCFYAKILLDVLATKQSNTSRLTCGNCEGKSEESWFCFQCGKFWCQDCFNAHSVLKETKTHRVLSFNDFQANDFEELLKRPVNPLPQGGVTAEQKEKCNEQIRKEKEAIVSRLDDAKQSSNATACCIQRLEDTSRLLDYRSQTNKELIQQTVQSLILTLRQKERESIEEVEDKTKKAQEQFRKQKVELSDKLCKREEIISQIECLLQRRPGDELAGSTALIDYLFKGLHEHQDLPGEPLATADLKNISVFVKNEQIAESLQKLGIGHQAAMRTTTEANQCSVKWFQTATEGLQAEIEVVTRNSDGEHCYFPGDYVTVELMSAQQRNIAVETRISDKKNGTYIISFIPSEPGKHLPRVQVNGDRIKEFPPIEVKERSFKPVGCLTEVSDRKRHLKHPWGVATNALDDIIVSDMENDRIVVFNEKGQFVRSFGEGVVDKPSGICVDKENRIYVANRGNDKILLFNHRGEYITAIHHGETLQEPRGISLDAEGNLIVCDTGNGCLRLMSPNGSILKTIGKGALRMPFGCLFHKDKVFVSDLDSHLIQVYDFSNRTFLYEFGRFMADVELIEPTGIAVDKAGHILICSGNSSNNPNSIHVYKTDGKLVRIFGQSCGGELGQFNTPTGITVLQNGRIVVCDFRNCRLQIFE